MNLTEEQLAIIDAARNTEDNLLISALAGAAKTTTLVEIAKALPDTEMLCLAFNKKIALEMQERLPTNCKAMTLNSLGHRVWSEATGRRLRINSSKTYELLSAVIEEQSPEDRKPLYENMAELIRLVDFGKSCGYIPTGTYERGKPLMNDAEFFAHIDQELSPLEQDVIRNVTLRSLKLAFEGQCDFNDQILMPTIFHGAFPRYPLVLVDEAQDLSALNHAMMRKLAKRRLIAVGDQCQAIYGFRGAHEDGMASLRHAFSMREMILSTSFRCSRAVVEHAQWRAPHMRYPDWAKPGLVQTLSKWTAATPPDDAAIICRNNAPLFGMAIRLLRNGRTCELDGKDVILSITKIMRKFGGSDMRQQAVLDAVDRWEEKERDRNKRSAWGRIGDRAECMRIFARQGDTLSEALAYAQHIMHLRSPLKLMTGHKSKGLEFTDVFFLDEELVSDEGQDPNLRYVIITRSKDTLTYVSSKDFHND